MASQPAMRAGPNARYAPNGRYHPFDGDGMVHAAHFENGKLTYRNRYVKTDGWKEEDKAGQSTFYGIRETLKDRPDKRLKDTANTDLAAHAGKVLAHDHVVAEHGDVQLHRVGHQRRRAATAAAAAVQIERRAQDHGS